MNSASSFLSSSEPSYVMGGWVSACPHFVLLEYSVPPQGGSMKTRSCLRLSCDARVGGARRRDHHAHSTRFTRTTAAVIRERSEG